MGSSSYEERYRVGLPAVHLSLGRALLPSVHGWEPAPSLEYLLSLSECLQTPHSFLTPFSERAQSWKRGPSEEQIC